MSENNDITDLEIRMRSMEAAVMFYHNERGGSYERNIKNLAQQIYDWVKETPSHLQRNRATHVEPPEVQ